MRSLRILALALPLAAATGHARAEEPSPQALAAANDLLAVMSPDMMKQLSAAVTARYWPTVEQKAHAEKIDDATIGELRAEFERVQIGFASDTLKDAAPIYARHFTVDELQELIAFYRSPIGAKALRELPQVMGEMSAQMAPRMQEVQQQVNEAFNKVLREHGYQK